MAGVNGLIAVKVETDGAVLVYKARNRLTAMLALLFGAFALTALGAFAAGALSAQDAPSLLLVLTLIGGLGWTIYHWGVRPRAHVLKFTRRGIEAGGAAYVYEDIESYGLTSDGVPPYDVAGSPMPKNATLGWHIYLNHKGLRTPITVGATKALAESIYKEFECLFERYSAS